MKKNEPAIAEGMLRRAILPSILGHLLCLIRPRACRPGEHTPVMRPLGLKVEPR
jgi:hypothetical protein